MWDSAGLERYRALIPSYVRGASIIFIIYDISSKESFNNLNTWINFIKQVNTDNSMIVLCGNKTDLERKVTTKEGQILANKEKMLFFEVSAKNGENVTKMMYSCIAELPFFEQFKEGNKDELIKELSNGAVFTDSIKEWIKFHPNNTMNKSIIYHDYFKDSLPYEKESRRMIIEFAKLNLNKKKDIKQINLVIKLR